MEFRKRSYEIYELAYLQKNISKISVEKIIKVADKIENTFLEKYKI